MAPALLSADEAGTPAEPDIPVATWVERLDDTSYQVREQATQVLTKLGPQAVESVVRAAREGSLEASTRAVRILVDLSQRTENPELCRSVLRRIAQLDEHPSEQQQAVLDLELLSTQQLLSMNASAEAWATPSLLDPQRLAARELREPRVRILRLGSNWKGGDAGLACLGDLRALEQLWIHGASFGDRGLAELQKATTLREIHLFGTAVSEQGVDQLRKALPDANVVVRKGAKLGVRGALGQTGGALILQVLPDEAADRAGLRRDDVITRFNGSKVDNFEELTSRIAELGAGDKAQLEVHRGAETIEVDVVFGQWR